MSEKQLVDITMRRLIDMTQDEIDFKTIEIVSIIKDDLLFERTTFDNRVSELRLGIIDDDEFPYGIYDFLKYLNENFDMVECVRSAFEDAGIDWSDKDNNILITDILLGVHSKIFTFIVSVFGTGDSDDKFSIGEILYSD